VDTDSCAGPDRGALPTDWGPLDSTTEANSYAVPEGGLPPSWYASDVGFVRERQTSVRLVAGYEVLGVLGRGGMATVHLARELRTDGLFALKTMSPDVADDEAAAIVLEDEARVLARIVHPNVVPVVDVVRSEGEVVLVMPFVRGVTVAELLVAASRAESPLSPGIVSAIGQDVLDGLQAAHEATSETGQPLGVVHRDVSPQNVLVDVEGCARVLDFGIAKAVGRAAKTTRDGSLKGKVAYMCPEQIHGEPLDRTADLYALGIVLWEAIALERLFAGSNEVDTMRRALMADVPSLESSRPELPAGTDAFFARALARSPRARFPTAREMADALQSLYPREPREVVARAVETLGAKELAKRKAPMPSRSPSNPPSDRGPSAELPGALSEADPTARSLAPPPSPETPAPRTTRSARILSLGVALAVSVLALVVWTRSRGEPGHVTGSPSATGAPSAELPRAAAESPPSESVASTPIVLPRRATAAGSASTNASASSSPVKRSGAGASKPKSLPAGCDIPYLVDSSGHKKYRPECLP
jgi:serine/threonine protein kinase